MRQEVNLYRPELHERHEPLEARALLRVTSLVALGLLLLYAYGRWQTERLNLALTGLAAQRDAASERLLAVTERLGPRPRDRLLQARVAALDAQVVARRRLVERLEGLAQDPPASFSRRLTGLARRHVEGTWITGLELRGDGRDVVLKGRALRPALVPAYLRELSREPGFHGTRLGVLELSRADPSQEAIDFLARTRAAPQ